MGQKVSLEPSTHPVRICDTHRAVYCTRVIIVGYDWQEGGRGPYHNHLFIPGPGG
jgi:hypothetical protein